LIGVWVQAFVRVAAAPLSALIKWILLSNFKPDQNIQLDINIIDLAR